MSWRVKGTAIDAPCRESNVSSILVARLVYDEADEAVHNCAEKIDGVLSKFKKKFLTVIVSHHVVR